MDNYNIPLAIFVFLNLCCFVIGYFYYDLVKAQNEVSEKQNRLAVAVYTFSQGLIGITAGSIILFAGLPLVGKLVSTLLGNSNFDKAISIEESFLINFCVFFGFLGIIILNKIIPFIW